MRRRPVYSGGEPNRAPGAKEMQPGPTQADESIDQGVAARDRGSGPERLVAGAMSGTSADGVDVAVVRVGGRGLGMSAALVRHHHVPYDPQLRQAIFHVRAGGTVEMSALARVGRDVSLAYARAVAEALAEAGLFAG